MKSVLVLFACVVLAQASIDLSSIKPRHIEPRIPIFPKIPASDWSDQRIVGGNEAVAHSRPYQAALLISTDEGTFFCGGSLISRKFVLTAAHCVDTANSVQVILGAHRFAESEESQVRIQVNSSNIRVHKNWNDLFLINDIATIELTQAVELNDNIQLVDLPSRSDASNSFAAQQAVVSGWGRDSDSATSVSPVLREVQVNVLVKLTCNIAYFGTIRNSHICTSGSGGVGSCNGDSGGPLVISNKQIGIVSFGLALGCEIGWPSVFSRVTSFLDWIEANSDVVIS